MIRYFSVSLLLVVIIGSYLAFTDIEPEPVVVEPEPEESVIDETLANYLEDFERDFEVGLIEEKIPGAAVAIVKDGQIIFQKGFGVKKKGTSEKVDENTLFRLGSLSKGFASVLTGKFVEKGVVGWNDPVSRYLKYFKLNDHQQTDLVQIRHLLSHTSGLPRHAYTNLIEGGLSLDRIIPRLEQVPLIAKVGGQHSYQNAAYSAIEKVLEVQTNTDFNTLIHENLFEPLRMNHTSASYESIENSVNKALPHVVYSRSRGRVPVPISEKYYNAVSSGGLNASAADMGKWLQLLTGHHPEVVSDETLQEIYNPIATLNNRRYSRHWEGVNKSYYGMGWRVLDNHGQKIVYHGGYVNGYRSEIAFAPDDDVGICILINTHSSYPSEVMPEFFNNFNPHISQKKSIRFLILLLV
ncbi:MAG: serine hydrolase domain-containing protein, partial [Balneolaceae bacterium]|nr:serine hydrolase domain-containing protein [Balneolaceae bacterium]